MAFVKSYIPGTDARKERKKGKEVKSLAAASAQTVNIDDSKIDGSATATFNKHLMMAIRTGHDMSATRDDASPANLIREIITRPEFINAIRYGDLISPHEEVDEDYKAEMTRRRMDLAREFSLAAEEPTRLMGEFGNQDLDIIYSTFLGTAPYQRDKGAAGIWSRENCPGWPEGLPMPPRAFFIFLESVARLQAKGRKGDDAEKAQGIFIGNVCKHLAWRGMGTFTRRQNPLLRQLVDQSELELYINSHASVPIEAAVAHFLDKTRRLLNTPTKEMDSELGVPGLGYAEEYEAEAIRLAEEIDNADGVLASALLRKEESARNLKNALERLADAEKLDRGLLAAMQKASKEGSVQIDGRAYPYDELAELQKESTEARNQAYRQSADARASHAEAETAEKDAGKKLSQKKNSLEAYMESANPEAVAQVRASEFRAFLENRGGDLGGPEEAVSAQAAADAVDVMPNKAVAELLETGRRLLEAKEVLPALLDKEPLGDGKREYLGDLMISLEMVPGNFDTERFDGNTLAILKNAATQIGMLPARYDNGQLSEEDIREFASLSIAMQRLQPRFAYEQEIRAERKQLAQRALESPDTTAFNAKDAFTGLEMAVKTVELTKADESRIAVANREDLQAYVASATGRIRQVLDLDSQVREQDMVFGHIKTQFLEDLAEFGQSIDGARLPEEVKGKVSNIHRLLSKKEPLGGTEKELVERIIADLDGSYAHPLRKAAERSLKKLRAAGYGQATGLGNIAWVNAKITFQAHSGDIQDPVPKEKGKWERFRAWISRWTVKILTPENWAAVPGWLWNRLIARDLNRMLNRNRWTREIETERNRYGETVVNMKWPNAVRGASNLLFKAYLTLMVGGYMMARPETTGCNYVNPVHIAGRLTLTPIATHFNKKEGEEEGQLPTVRKDRPLLVRLLTPWTWTWKHPDELPKSFMINDHPSNPETLKKRGEAYYRQNYGVGTLEVKDGSTTRVGRLAWLQSRPEVLRFFQERIDGYRVVRVQNLKANPSTCMNHRKKRSHGPVAELRKDKEQRIRLPGSCTAHPFNLKTREQVLAWEYGRKTGGWDIDRDKMCCLLKIETSKEGMSDSALKLNPTMADAVVDWLIATERGGQKIDYAFLTSKDSMLKWKNMWFLVTVGELKIIKDHELTGKDTVRFLLSQGSAATSMFYPDCAGQALSPEFLRKERRDDFVRAWVAEIGKDSDAKPMEQQVSPGALKTAYQNMKKANQDWFVDRTVEHNRQKVMDALPWLGLKTDEAKDALAADSGLLDLVKSYDGSPHRIDVDRSDEFVLLLEAEKRRGGPKALLDYDPHKSSFKLQQAVSMGYLTTKEAGPTSVREGSTATLPRTAIYDAKAETFYTDNPEFAKFVEDSIDAMFKGERKQKDIMEGALKGAFGDDRAAMNNALKAHVLNMVENRHATLHRTRIQDEDGVKKILFPPEGHPDRKRTVSEMQGLVQRFLAPMFRPRAGGQ